MPLGEVHDGPHIDFECFPDGRQAAVQDGAHVARDGGVQDQHVDHNAVGLERIPQAGRVLETRNVAYHAGYSGRVPVGHLGGKSLRRRLDNIGAASEDDDPRRLGLNEAPGNGEADAGGSARNEHGASSLGELGAEGRDAGVGGLVEGSDRGDVQGET